MPYSLTSGPNLQPFPQILPTDPLVPGSGDSTVQDGRAHVQGHSWNCAVNMERQHGTTTSPNSDTIGLHVVVTVVVVIAVVALLTAAVIYICYRKNEHGKRIQRADGDRASDTNTPMKTQETAGNHLLAHSGAVA